MSPAPEIAAVDLPSHSPGKKAPAILALTGSAACWGLATVMSKGALADIGPFTLLVAQLSASVLFLWTVLLVRGLRVPFDSSARRMALSGILEPGLAFAAGISGLALTSAAHSSVIEAVEPLFIVLVAWAVLRIRPGHTTLCAIGCAALGVALVSFDLRGTESSTSLLGDGLIVLGNLLAAFYVVISSRLATRIEPLPLATLQQCVGLLFSTLTLVVVLVLGFEPPSVVHVPAATWLLAIVSGVVQFALPFWLYLIGLRVLPLATAALFLALIPVFGVGGAMIFLGERLTIVQGVGCGVAVAAVLVASRGLARIAP